jgi:hypothetical protein
MDDLCSTIGISKGSLPIRYLGLSLSVHYPKSSHYAALMDSIRRRIDGWIVHSLNFAGRVELIRSVILSSISYGYFTYNLPRSIIKEIERLCANFLWKGKLHNISWAKLCTPKKEGGLGIKSIPELCEAAGLKRLWRFLTTKSMWGRWMKHKYI